MIVEVVTKKQEKQFLAVPKKIYAGDHHWVCPLDDDIRQIFDPKRNNFHQHGECCRWILYSNQEPIGRIAAFIDQKKAYKKDLAKGGIGFFECIDDQDAANELFNVAKAWLIERGMQAMEGPINFGENDSFWGLLIEGFSSPSYGMNYHKPYYQNLFFRYGFKIAYEQITNHLDVNKPFPERFTRIAKWVMEKPGYTFKHFQQDKLTQFAKDFIEIYNDAWEDFENFHPMQMKTVLESFKKMKPILDERLIWFAYVHDQPVSFILILPDTNQLIKDFNGKMNIWNALRFVMNRRKKVNRMRAIVMGTKKAYQKHGIESALFIKLKEYVLPLKKYELLELSWVGDFNKEMLAIHKATGAQFGKKHATLDYLF
ncbi:GNAT family N-acetyltransferase [Olivibacter ginsenosidimutans]|uniref:GNAT family N-acetyltransferase n=1 Tax=Olivibacter ginsenosidimutans TaxID=1176537 RepID=A0ABP9B7Q3_9SPHI